VNPSQPEESTALSGDHVSAIILAGGMGVRMGGQPKALLQAHGQTLLERVVIQAGDHASEVIVGLPQEVMSRGKAILGDRAILARGGETRQATFQNTLALATGEIVVIHDVARPFASGVLWDAVIAGAREHGAAAPVVPIPVRDSIAMRDGEWLGAPVDRDRIVSIQTPYAFRRSILEWALAAANETGGNETSVTTLVTRIGHRVLLVPGENANTKVTFEEDWLDAQRRISESQGAATSSAKSRTREL
jgi:2-C-methyl-D-erythritol 4-phosphate cytidylyltransferase